MAAIDFLVDFLFVDDDLVVVNKPSGLLVHRGWANDDDVAMFRVRDALGAHVYPVHRLDRGTSGVLVFARTREAAATLSLAFESRQVDKRYLALVRGSPAASGTIDHPIPKRRKRSARPRRHPLLPGRAVQRRSLLAGPRHARDGSRASDPAAPAPPRASARRRRELRVRPDQPPLPRDLRPASARASRARRRVRSPGLGRARRDHGARCRTTWDSRSNGSVCRAALTKFGLRPIRAAAAASTRLAPPHRVG